MLEHLKNEFNQTYTENGAKAYKSTESYVLDLFSMGGVYRNREDEEVCQLFSKAFSENPLLAMKTLFNLRDVRGGQGERRFFKVVLKYLSLHHKDSLKKNLHLIPKYGRWDDMWVLLETNLKHDVLKIVREQLHNDVKSENPSLLGKWMPSLNASSKETKKYAKILQQGLGGTPKQYRKLLTNLRGKINIVESNLSSKNYDDINYNKLPSKASLIYRNAFLKNDESRYREYLEGLASGETTVNAGAIYPYEIAREGLSWRKVLSEEDIKLLDAQWNSLPNFIGDNHDNSLAVVDTSGSMTGTPMEVAISLGIYLSERNKGQFKDYFMTFSSDPQLQKVVGEDIIQKIRNLSHADWGMSTNIEKVFTKILDTAVKNNVSQEEMIKKVIIISDMEFNYCTNVNEFLFDALREMYEEHGYELPNLTFWNVDARNNSTQFKMNDVGVELVSGFSPSLFKNVLGSINKTPYELMLEVINDERYDDITV